MLGLRSGRSSASGGGGCLRCGCCDFMSNSNDMSTSSGVRGEPGEELPVDTELRGRWGRWSGFRRAERGGSVAAAVAAGAMVLRCGRWGVETRQETNGDRGPLVDYDAELLRDWACGGFRRAFGRTGCTCERAHSSDSDALHTGRTHGTAHGGGGRADRAGVYGLLASGPLQVARSPGRQDSSTRRFRLSYSSQDTRTPGLWTLQGRQMNRVRWLFCPSGCLSLRLGCRRAIAQSHTLAAQPQSQSQPNGAPVKLRYDVTARYRCLVHAQTSQIQSETRRQRSQAPQGLQDPCVGDRWAMRLRGLASWLPMAEAAERAERF